ncbi:type I-E CRISPR-associated endonuclease Cas1e [Caldimonas thermodepolymerans]|jgi:CRISPR-associated endonuclease Cas1, subtype I-E/ECOLI|uniref:CRISPR-associated endonuclease Cas1 n=1 Tax=Caldimonas thermodepolymerans TaxID=215580 RepID=A0AA46HVW3_9BURK|nr:type I-E CRISPR-associated endonuclease Cas1e [Caldimonas thermodepolymerans]TCP07490.1 CRISPR-associated Cas1 family protein [Caldimonas thermodepolymerans]UZG43997.1 type I-E CRISPR-associated endonuclease Cas1e [Caldimonas thermodepolymerans]UZG47664.1 type I-E CRISPR-associated endonuclease Cas1e [Caldimonas thermodepolymerans]
MSSGPGLLHGRLGLAASRIPHADRHGLLWLEYGRLSVEDGTLRFIAARSETLDAGDYAIPYQAVSMILLGPGTSITQDVLRLCARHGVLIAAVGEGGVKSYTAPPLGQGRSDVARAHAERWADPKRRLDTARRLYAWRFGRVLPHRDIETLRGIEGARIKESYRLAAQRFGIQWDGRRYDRQNPQAADLPNQALNHAATFVEAAADLAVAAVGALPPLGFIHEDSSNAFTLDVADLYRVDLTLPLAFGAVRACQDGKADNLEREVRRRAARLFRQEKLIPRMIDRIKELFDVDDRGGDA